MLFEPIMKAVHGASCFTGGVGDGQMGFENEREGMLPNFATVADTGHECRNKINPTRMNDAKLS